MKSSQEMMRKQRYLGRWINQLAVLVEFALHPRTYFSKLSEYPETIYLELTSACPLACPMCPRTFMKRKVQHISIELVEKFADELSRYYPKCPKLALHGFGEATCHPKLLEILQLLRRKLPDTQLTVSLNLALAEPKHIDLLFEGGIHEIGVWIDSETKEVYEQQRTGGEFEKTLEAVDYLLALKRKSNSELPLFHIGMVLTKLNQDHLKDFVLHWRKKMEGLKGVSIRSTAGHTFNGNVDDSILLEPKSDWYVYRACAKPFQEVLILADGSICICCYDAEGESSVGNLRDMKLRDAWRSHQFKEIRKKFMSLKSPFKMCENCSSVRYYPLDGRPRVEEHLHYHKNIA